MSLNLPPQNLRQLISFALETGACGAFLPVNRKIGNRDYAQPGRKEQSAYLAEVERLRALNVVSAIQASGQENVGQENRRFAIFLSYIFLSAGRNEERE